MSRARISDIATLASRLSGFTLAELKGPSRKRRFTLIRTAIAFVARDHGHSFPEIGRVMNRDHSSIVHIVHNAKGWMRVYPEFAVFTEKLAEQAKTVTPFLDGMKFDFILPPTKRTRKPKPKNDFSPGKEAEDGGHVFHAGIGTGSIALAAAIAKARAA